MSHLAFPLLVGLIIVALGFDFLNGLHDAANSIATVVGTRLVSPVGAVAFAAFFNFAAYFLALKWPALHNVAETIGKGLIDKDLVTPAVVFGALIGAMLLERRDVAEGYTVVIEPCAGRRDRRRGRSACRLPQHPVDRARQTLIAIVASPVLGLVLTMAIMLLTSWLGVRASARGSDGRFGGCTWFHPERCRSATASTMLRKRWG